MRPPVLNGSASAASSSNRNWGALECRHDERPEFDRERLVGVNASAELIYHRRAGVSKTARGVGRAFRKGSGSASWARYAHAAGEDFFG